ncbi:head-tail connector protein [Qipengyuania aquimaris]|uniref:head-tail connector protein n=1 Tax=Qipengyuania aquimaris TaxID=255984 RepID=UPI001FD4251A|nr:hypothetical protein [Qipengyuania aquimaris]UOR16319.1 hypothetical protein LCM05_04550 [Qipengyuania aquimaris]
MKNIAAPASLSGAPLAELKSWLSITTNGEDDLLTTLVASALALCERFTGVVPLKSEVRETVLPSLLPQPLQAGPFISLTGAEAFEGLQRRELSPGEYRIDIASDGTASFSLPELIGEPQIEVTYLAGLASEWQEIDEGLRQGIIRHAAHLYRERESTSAAPLPASIAALWRPWRRLRL